MPPRKSKTPSKSAQHADSNAATPSTASKKRKIDWATIDGTNLLENGFTLKAVASKPTRKPSKGRKNKKQKVEKTAEVEREGYKNAPLDADIVQRNPYAERELSQTHYKVQPAHVWEETQRYRKFTISESEFEVGQTIFISKTEEPQDNDEAIQHWIGKVLEVRAGDAAHVYLRVYWQYRPEDLPGGRQPHHGASELIASNHMDIIEALSVADKANVIHWDDDPEKTDAPLLKDQLFWRQTFDVEKPKGKQLSTLRTICADNTPINPDEDLIQCPSCSEWLHARCLENQAVKDAGGSTAKEPAKKKGRRKSSSGVAFTASLITSKDNGPAYLTVQDGRPGQSNHRYNVDITCLLCKSLIDAAPKDLPPSESNTKNETFAMAAELPILSTSAPTQDAEATDAVKHEEPKTEPLAPETKPAVVKRGRGRPRKYPLPTTCESISVATVQEVVPPALVAVAPRSAMPVPAEVKNEQSVPIQQIATLSQMVPIAQMLLKPQVTPSAQVTPLSAQVSETVFQSGIKSVKKLFWRNMGDQGGVYWMEKGNV